MIGWDHPATAASYERFCRRHVRYRRANEVLVCEAAITPGLRVLDFGAGSGRTTSAMLPQLGPDGSVVCVEPAEAMRLVGRRRLGDPRVTWRAGLPDGKDQRDRFDRVVAGAVMWQLECLDDAIRQLASLIDPGGALVFDIPALYLGEPDDAGGGRDPLLLDLITKLMTDAGPRLEPLDSEQVSTWKHGRDDVEAALSRAGLRYRAWEFRHRLTQRAYADWLSIPVMTNALFHGVDSSERERRIERALAGVDLHSFKWERWRGWTAWKS